MSQTNPRHTRRIPDKTSAIALELAIAEQDMCPPALEELGAKTVRLLLVLHLLGDAAPAAISKRVNMTESAVRSHLNRLLLDPSGTELVERVTKGYCLKPEGERLIRPLHTAARDKLRKISELARADGLSGQTTVI